MIQAIANAKVVKLKSGQVVTIKKITFQTYYLLMIYLFNYKKAAEKVSKIKYNGIIDYIKQIKQNALNIAINNVELKNIKYIINISIMEKIKINDNIIFELAERIINFNSIRLSVKGKEFQNIEEINNQMEYMIGIISEMLKLTPSQIMQLDNYDICYLVREFNNHRINQINDIRVAQNADKNDYIKYTSALAGNVVVTGDDIMKNPNIIKEMENIN
jgi:hypothetical protein